MGRGAKGLGEAGNHESVRRGQTNDFAPKSGHTCKKSILKCTGVIIDVGEVGSGEKELLFGLGRVEVLVEPEGLAGHAFGQR